MAEIDDLTGRRFGRLAVVGPHYSVNRRTVWPCLCDCGNTKDVRAGNLKSGYVKSCGCFRREFTTTRNTTHGQASRQHSKRPPEYVVWCLMRRRCSDPSDSAWPSYGGRGIKVCARWKSFENFYADMGPRPTPDHQLDRADNMAGYEPSNCRWVTRVENCSNRRDNLFIEWRGETYTVSEWARRIGIKTATLYARIYLLKWGVEAAMTTPVRQMRRKPKIAQAA